MKLYFTHKTSWSRHETNNYTFTHILWPTYWWYIREWVFTIENTIPVDSDKKSKYWFKDWQLVRWIWSITDEWFWIITIDEDKLKALIKTSDDIKNKLLKQNIVEINVLSSNEAIAWISRFTDYKEVEPWKFLMKEESKDEMLEEIIPAQYLIIE